MDLANAKLLYRSTDANMNLMIYCLSIWPKYEIIYINTIAVVLLIRKSQKYVS